MKFKAHFCVDGRTQEEGVDFHETHATVVKWNTIRTCLTMYCVCNWHAREIDFDQFYAQ